MTPLQKQAMMAINKTIWNWKIENKPLLSI